MVNNWHHTGKRGIQEDSEKLRLNQKCFKAKHLSFHVTSLIWYIWEKVYPLPAATTEAPEGSMSERTLKEALPIAAHQTKTRAALDYKIIYTQNRWCGSLSRATGQSHWLSGQTIVGTCGGIQQWPPLPTSTSDWFTLCEKLSNLTMFQLKCLQF